MAKKKSNPLESFPSDLKQRVEALIANDPIFDKPIPQQLQEAASEVEKWAARRVGNPSPDDEKNISATINKGLSSYREGRLPFLPKMRDSMLLLLKKPEVKKGAKILWGAAEHLPEVRADFDKHIECVLFTLALSLYPFPGEGWTRGKWEEAEGVLEELGMPERDIRVCRVGKKYGPRTKPIDEAEFSALNGLRSHFKSIYGPKRPVNNAVALFMQAAFGPKWGEPYVRRQAGAWGI
jgi:hypothetical protein